MSLDQYLQAKAALIEDQLDRLIPEQSQPFKQLFQAARYSLLGGGKRLRPILALATCEALGGDEEAALIPACALEMVHTYSMIHDDLPCMDDDDFRRGKPSLHRTFPEGHAVLTGDYLLTYAFEALSAAPYLTPEQIVRLITSLAKNAGGEGMIAGQIMDIEASGQSLDDINTIYRYKTGALIATAVEFGGIVAGASKENLDTLSQYAHEIGLAFQIIDDILDPSDEKRGGHLASDAVNGKITYMTLLGAETSQQIAEKLLKSAIDRLHSLPLKTNRLSDLAFRLVQRKN